MQQRNAKRLDKLLFSEGVISTSFGSPGAGMTNLAVAMMERAIQHGYSVYTNVMFLDKQEQD